MRIRHVAYGLYVWAAFAAASLSVTLLLTVMPGEERRMGAARRGARVFFWLARIPLHVTGMAQLPNSPCIVVANHASYLDGVILTAVLPNRFRFVVKKEMTRIPGAHFFLRRIGTAFVDRFNKQRSAADARRLIQRAKDGQSLAFFPEGTFRQEPGLRRFHVGAFAAAARGALPAVPIAIRGSRAILASNDWLARPGAIEVDIMAPLHAGTSDQPVMTLMHECRERVLAGVGEPDLTQGHPV